MTATIRQLLHVVAGALARLSPREQRLVAIFGALLAAAGLYVLLIEPIAAGRRGAENKIATLDGDVREMQRLAVKIRELQGTIDLTDTDDGTAGKDFSLFSFIDKATSASVSRDAIASMNPNRRPTREGLEETTVELRLTNISLTEVVGLLRQIETAPEPVYVKRVELKRRFDDNTRFDAIIVTGSVSHV